MIVFLNILRWLLSLVALALAIFLSLSALASAFSSTAILVLSAGVFALFLCLNPYLSKRLGLGTAPRFFFGAVLSLVVVVLGVVQMRTSTMRSDAFEECTSGSDGYDTRLTSCSNAIARGGYTDPQLAVLHYSKAESEYALWKERFDKSSSDEGDPTGKPQSDALNAMVQDYSMAIKLAPEHMESTAKAKMYSDRALAIGLRSDWAVENTEQRALDKKLELDDYVEATKLNPNDQDAWCWRVELDPTQKTKLPKGMECWTPG